MRYTVKWLTIECQLGCSSLVKAGWMSPRFDPWGWHIPDGTELTVV